LTTRTPVIFSLYAPVILLLILAHLPELDNDLLLEIGGDEEQHGMINSTSSANCQLIVSMKATP